MLVFCEHGVLALSTASSYFAQYLGTNCEIFFVMPCTPTKPCDFVGELCSRGLSSVSWDNLRWPIISFSIFLSPQGFCRVLARNSCYPRVTTVQITTMSTISKIHQDNPTTNPTDSDTPSIHDKRNAVSCFFISSY